MWKGQFKINISFYKPGEWNKYFSKDILRASPIESYLSLWVKEMFPTIKFFMAWALKGLNVLYTENAEYI